MNASQIIASYTRLAFQCDRRDKRLTVQIDRDRTRKNDTTDRRESRKGVRALGREATRQALASQRAWDQGNHAKLAELEEGLGCLGDRINAV